MGETSITQIIIAMIVAIGGVLTARATAGKGHAVSAAGADDLRVLMDKLKTDLHECLMERKEEQAFYFRELFKRDRTIRILRQKARR